MLPIHILMYSMSGILLQLEPNQQHLVAAA